ncbi:Shedu anti-phage system protein SduA domain-containing protein [Streptomyces sp. NPDC058394]|uniref:Shedu anti-phage system protein SduA domain-containing protein n=1 Tax=Streptomyces sp. NPDC058394 TaxID=3346477 RepID=UPI0036682B72
MLLAGEKHCDLDDGAHSREAMTVVAPTWASVAAQLRRYRSAPTAAQLELAARLDVGLAADTPTAVAAGILRMHLREPLQLRRARECTYGQFSYLRDLAELTGAAVPEEGVDRELADGWISALHAQRVAESLEHWKPEPGEVTVRRGGPGDRFDVISSIADSGRLYCRGGGGQWVWPQHVERIIRVGEQEYTDAVAKAKQQAALRRKNAHMLGRGALERLNKWRVEDLPGLGALRALENVLAQASDERPMQVVLEQHPQILGHLVSGNHRTFVRHQVRFADKFVADFVIGGVTSMGVLWRLVELESPTARLVLNDGQPSATLRKAVQQIRDWRRWIAEHFHTAGDPEDLGGTGLEGIRLNPPGLVIIGRDDSAAPTETMRNEFLEEARIEIRTYDWLVRAVASRPPMRIGALDIELEESWDEED